MFRAIIAATLAAFALFCSEAAAQRVIEYNSAYLPPLPESNIAHFDNAAVIVMSEADANLVTLESEAHMPFTIGRYRIQIPIGSIVQNTTLATYGQIFEGGVTTGADLTGAPDGAITVTISRLRVGYDYRQIDERRPANPGEMGPPSTPSAEFAFQVVFSNAEGELYDTMHPPFAQRQEPCRTGDFCIGTRLTTSRQRGVPQSGYGNSKEVINRALHELIQHLLLSAACEFEADMEARERGERIVMEEAEVCRYPGADVPDKPE